MKKTENKDLNRLSKKEFKSKKKIPVRILLDNVRSMNNVGSCFRTCDAFLIEKIYLTGITAFPPHREIHKTALGATETVEWEHNKNPEDILKKLKKNKWKIILIEQTNKNLSEIEDLESEFLENKEQTNDPDRKQKLNEIENNLKEKKEIIQDDFNKVQKDIQ